MIWCLSNCLTAIVLSLALCWIISHELLSNKSKLLGFHSCWFPATMNWTIVSDDLFWLCCSRILSPILSNPTNTFGQQTTLTISKCSNHFSIRMDQIGFVHCNFPFCLHYYFNELLHVIRRQKMGGKGKKNKKWKMKKYKLKKI